MLLNVLRCKGQPPMTKHYSTRNTNSAEFEKSRSSSRVLNLQVLFSSLGIYEWTSRNLWTLSKICAKHRVCIHCLEEKAYDSHQSLKSHKCDRSQNSVPVISHTRKVFPMAFFCLFFSTMPLPFIVLTEHRSVSECRCGGQLSVLRRLA